MLARGRGQGSGADYLREATDHCEAPQLIAAVCQAKGVCRCERTARKHDYHLSMGLFTPSPPRFKTCV